MSTADRVLGVLKLFTMDRPQWTIDEAAQAMGLPVSTMYRYFRSLTGAGLLVNFAAGRYVVGPAVIEMDRQARAWDPLIVAGRPVMAGLAGHVPPTAIIMLCRIYRLQVMCVDQVADPARALPISYERGRLMPLYPGSASKVILAHLRPATLRSCFAEDCAAIAQAGLGEDWETFKASLRAIRKSGVAITCGDIDPGIMGISAPVISPEGDIVGSISIVSTVDEADEDRRATYVDLIRGAGREVTERLREIAWPAVV